MREGIYVRQGGSFQSTWSKPAAVEWIKINVDGSYAEGTGKAGVGIIARDNTPADQLELNMYYLQSFDIVVAETAL